MVPGMAKTFRDEIHDAVTASQKVKADAVQASNTAIQQQQTIRRAECDQSIQLMEKALQEAAAGLNKVKGLTATVEPLHRLENGDPQQFGHIFKISGTGFPKTTVTLNYAHSSLEIVSATKGQSQKTHNMTITTEDAAQELVRGIFKNIGLI